MKLQHSLAIPVVQVNVAHVLSVFRYHLRPVYLDIGSPVGGPHSLGEIKGALAVRKAQKNGPKRAVFSTACSSAHEDLKKVLTNTRCE